MANTFRFTGEVVLPKENFYKEMKGRAEGSTWRGKKVNFGIKHNDAVMWVEVMGGNHPTIYSKGLDGKDLEIDFKDRLDEDVVASVINWKKNVITDGEDKTEFISEYDFVEALNEMLPKLAQLEGKKIIVSGLINEDLHQGKVYTKYIPQRVMVVQDGWNEKTGFKAEYELFYEEDCVDADDFEEDKKIYITAYANQYGKGSEDEKDKSINKQNFKVAKQVVINGTALNKLEGDQKAFFEKKIGFMKKQFEVNSWHKMGWECVIFKGSEEAELAIEDLSDFEQEQIEFEMKSFEDFKKQYSKRTPSKEEIRLVRIASRYTQDGAIEVDEEDMIFYNENTANVNDGAEDTAKPKQAKTTKPAEKDELDLDSLFAE